MSLFRRLLLAVGAEKPACIGQGGSPLSELVSGVVMVLDTCKLGLPVCPLAFSMVTVVDRGGRDELVPRNFATRRNVGLIAGFSLFS